MEQITNTLSAIESRLADVEAVIARLGQLTLTSPSVLSYPEPISSALAKEGGARFHHERFFGLLDAGEICIQYSGIVAMALLLQSGSAIDLKAEFKQPIPLGLWAGHLRKLRDDSAATDNLIGKELVTSLFKSNGKPTPTGRFWMDEFLNLRNSERGHGSSLPDEAYEALHLRHSSEIYHALESCSYLKYPLVRVESVDISSEPFNYDLRLLIGPPPITITKRIHSTSRVRLGSTCVWDRREMLLYLEDLIIYRNCPTCNVEHTFLLEEWDDSTKKYRAYIGNHRYSQREA